MPWYEDEEEKFDFQEIIEVEMEYWSGYKFSKKYKIYYNEGQRDMSIANLFLSAMEFGSVRKVHNIETINKGSTRI